NTPKAPRGALVYYPQSVKNPTPLGYFICHFGPNAHHPHGLPVRAGCCTLSMSKLAVTMYAYWDRF
ncbi:MAG: hypothetical protein N6V49_05635, partial [Serratia symbiotica]|nr:hypothetical protein [Serratia symbiotica]